MSRVAGPGPPPGARAFAFSRRSWRWSFELTSNASFQGASVFFKGKIPFVLVPYHGGYPTFKDGTNNEGAPFTPVLPTSANAPAGAGTPPGASNDSQYGPGNPGGAVVVEQIAADLLDPARLVIWVPPARVRHAPSSHAYDENLVHRLRDLLAREQAMAERKMLGGRLRLPLRQRHVEVVDRVIGERDDVGLAMRSSRPHR